MPSFENSLSLLHLSSIPSHLQHDLSADQFRVEGSVPPPSLSPTPQHVTDLSIVPLDSTLTDSLLLPPSHVSHGIPGVEDLPALQNGMSHFHDAVSSLLQHYLTLSSQVIGSGSFIVYTYMYCIPQMCTRAFISFATILTCYVLKQGRCLMTH